MLAPNWCHCGDGQVLWPNYRPDANMDCYGGTIPPSRFEVPPGPCDMSLIGDHLDMEFDGNEAACNSACSTTCVDHYEFEVGSGVRYESVWPAFVPLGQDPDPAQYSKCVCRCENIERCDICNVNWFINSADTNPCKNLSANDCRHRSFKAAARSPQKDCALFSSPQQFSCNPAAQFCGYAAEPTVFSYFADGTSLCHVDVQNAKDPESTTTDGSTVAGNKTDGAAPLPLKLSISSESVLHRIRQGLPILPADANTAKFSKEFSTRSPMGVYDSGCSSATCPGGPGVPVQRYEYNLDDAETSNLFETLKSGDHPACLVQLGETWAISPFYQCGACPDGFLDLLTGYDTSDIFGYLGSPNENVCGACGDICVGSPLLEAYKRGDPDTRVGIKGCFYATKEVVRSRGNGDNRYWTTEIVPLFPEPWQKALGAIEYDYTMEQIAQTRATIDRTIKSTKDMLDAIVETDDTHVLSPNNELRTTVAMVRRYIEQKRDLDAYDGLTVAISRAIDPWDNSGDRAIRQFFEDYIIFGRIAQPGTPIGDKLPLCQTPDFTSFNLATQTACAVQAILEAVCPGTPNDRWNRILCRAEDADPPEFTQRDVFRRHALEVRSDKLAALNYLSAMKPYAATVTASGAEAPDDMETYNLISGQLSTDGAERMVALIQQENDIADLEAYLRCPNRENRMSAQKLKDIVAGLENVQIEWPRPGPNPFTSGTADYNNWAMEHYFKPREIADFRSRIIERRALLSDVAALNARVVEYSKNILYSLVPGGAILRAGKLATRGMLALALRGKSFGSRKAVLTLVRGAERGLEKVANIGLPVIGAVDAGVSLATTISKCNLLVENDDGDLAAYLDCVDSAMHAVSSIGFTGSWLWAKAKRMPLSQATACILNAARPSVAWDRITGDGRVDYLNPPGPNSPCRSVHGANAQSIDNLFPDDLIDKTWPPIQNINNQDWWSIFKNRRGKYYYDADPNVIAGMGSKPRGFPDNEGEFGYGIKAYLHKQYPDDPWNWRFAVVKYKKEADGSWRLLADGNFEVGQLAIQREKLANNVFTVQSSGRTFAYKSGGGFWDIGDFEKVDDINSICKALSHVKAH